MRPNASRLRGTFSKLEPLPRIVESREFTFRLQTKWTPATETVPWAYTFSGGGVEYPQQGQVEEDGYMAHTTHDMQGRSIDRAVGGGVLTTITSIVKRGIT